MKKQKRIFYALLIAVCVTSALFFGVRTTAKAETPDTSCPYAVGENVLNDPSFESPGTVPFTDARQVTDTWKTVSWAGTDANGWGHNSHNNVYLIYSDAQLLAGEQPTVYQDVEVERNSYYVVSLYAHSFGYTERQPALTVGFRNPQGNDPWIDLQNHELEAVGPDYEERCTVLYTQNYSKIRLTVFTESIYAGGELGGYHLDDVTMYKVKTPVAADFEMPATFTVGKRIMPDIKVRFEGETDFKSVQANDYIRTEYEVTEGDDVFVCNGQNTLVATEKGAAKVKLSLNIFGKTLESEAKDVIVGDANENSDVYVKSVSVRPTKDVTTAEFANLDVTVEMSDGSYAAEGEYDVRWTSTNSRVAAVRQLNGVYCVIAVGNGNADVVATVTTENSVGIGRYSVTIATDNYLVDSGFEAQADYHFWASDGTSGSGVDDGPSNIYMHSGISNIWIMAPVWWDGTVAPASDARISQTVTLPQGKYALSAYINRYNATGVDGMLSGQGGIATLGAVRLDSAGEETDDLVSKDFDTSYGAGGQYALLSLVFDVEEEGDYLVYYAVEGDAQYGLGMQLDDVTLKKAEYPLRIVADIGEEVIDVDDLNKIYVVAEYADGKKEQISGNIRTFFSDYRVACESGGFVIGKAAGKTDVKVKTTVLDREYETTFTVTVRGGAASGAQKGLPTAAVIAIIAGSVAVVGAGAALTVVGLRKKKKAGAKQ